MADHLAEMRELLSQLCNGELTDDQANRLESLVLADEACRDLYVEYMHLDANLQRRFAYQGDESLPSSADHARRATRRRPMRVLPLLAAGLAAAAAAVLVSFLIETNNHLQEHPPPEVWLQADGVAVLTNVVDAKWESDSPEVGSPVKACSLVLQSGIAQFEFVSGATVVLQGPAAFELVSADRAICRHGKLWSSVLPQARGFTISTPQGDIVDFGTEFALNVPPQGPGEVHVLQGKVELRPLAKGSPKPKSLSGGEAARFHTGQIQSIPVDRNSFVDDARLANLAGDQQRQRYLRWQQHSKALQADPGLVAYYSFDGHSPWTRVLQNVASSAGRDGAIVGCQWTTGRWPGKGALEFKRTSDRVRLNIPGEFASVTLAAWVRIEGLERWYNSLLLTDGWDRGEIHWQITDKGKLELSVHDLNSNREIDYISPRIIGPADLGRWIHLATVYDHQGKLVTHYVDGVEVYQRKKKWDFPVRVGPAEIGNWSIGRHADPTPIRSFNGLMDEFCLFDRALSAEEIKKMVAVGKPQT